MDLANMGKFYQLNQYNYININQGYTYSAARVWFSLNLATQVTN